MSSSFHLQTLYDKIKAQEANQSALSKVKQIIIDSLLGWQCSTEPGVTHTLLSIQDIQNRLPNVTYNDIMVSVEEELAGYETDTLKLEWKLTGSYPEKNPTIRVTLTTKEQPTTMNNDDDVLHGM